MTSAFSAQLRTIAAKSTNELDIRARREAHAESLIFDRSIAVKQDWETIYQICAEGFQELCMLDSRLREFQQNLYSAQSKTQDREQLNKAQNDALGVVLERCLGLLGSKITLRPGIKAIEWLVRRFRVHFYNTGTFLATFLPYHETPAFRNALSIVPANKITAEWKFLGPYHKIAANVPRHVVVYSATNNDAFFSFFNAYAIRVCQEGAIHPQLSRFWGSMVVEAIAARLDQVKSGRKEIQRQRLEDALLKILPLLIAGFKVKDCAELTLVCFSIALVVASSSDLEDHVIDSLMKAIAPFVTNGESDPKSATIALSILATKKAESRVPKDVLDVFMRSNSNLHTRLFELKGHAPVEALCEGLLSSSLSGLKKSNIDSRFTFISKLFDASPELLEPATTSRLVAVVLRKLQSTMSTNAPDPATQTRLIQLLQKLNDSSYFAPTFSMAVSLAGLSSTDVEAMIEGTIETMDRYALTEPTTTEPDTSMDALSTEINAAGSMLSALPSQSTELSFLATKRSPLFDQIAHAFTVCHRNEEHMNQFEDLPLWRQKGEKPSDLHASFLLRVACGPFTVSERTVCLQILSRTLEKGSRQNSQLLVPYLTVLLSDDAQSVRKAAVACMLAIQSLLTKIEEAEKVPQPEHETIYDPVVMENVKRIPSSQAIKLLTHFYVPNLEECILDASHMRKILEAAFEGSSRNPSTPSKKEVVELKKASKHTLFDLLTSCALTCPLMRVKLGLIGLFVGVHKVGTTTMSKTLSPMLEEWASLKDSEAEAVATLEGLSLSQIDATMVQLVNAQEKQGLEQILTILMEEKFHPRSDLVAAFFDRIIAIWKSVRPESQVSAAIRLFDMSFSNQQAQAKGSRHVLRTVTLSTECLAVVLEHAYSGLAQMPMEVPPKKRRRISHGRESIPKEMAVDLDIADSRLTFALELVDNSKPETHPQLLGNLFEILIVLRRLKDKSTSESPYLLNLCLSSILAIVEKARESRKPNIDTSSIRADLITDCVRSSENLQVQGTALLLSASLAALAPDRILHTIMPIFTFMGSTILSKDDERSIYVTNQAIDQIIPPLVGTLKRQDAKNLVHSTSSLLSSFVTAYDHVPQHRRVGFYQRLLDRLGAEDFLFAITALLASRRHPEDMSLFFASLMGDLPATTQLMTFRKSLDLVTDVFSESPHNAEPLLDITRSTGREKRQREAVILLETASRLLEPKALHMQMKRLQKTGDAAMEPFWNEFRGSISRLLAMLIEQKAHHPDLAPHTRKCLGALLEVPSLAELLQIMPDLLEEMQQVGDKQLPPLALRVLATQLQHKAPKDTKTQSQAVAFLPTIESIIASTDDEALRHASIACLDRIVEVYGRKSPDAIISASSTLFESDHGLDSQDARTQIMSILCLASMLEVLKEAAVPIVPQSMPKVLGLLRSSLSDEIWNAELHNAAFALVSSCISHVPFMISDENVVELIEICFRSCAARMDASCKESRVDTLSLMAHKLDLSTLTASLNQAWKPNSVNVDAEAITESLDMLSLAIERNSKSTVVRYADEISTFILHVLDLRRVIPSDSISSEDLSLVESKVQSLSIIFIYKLNDTTFRPIFESWVDWALKGRDIAATGESYSGEAKTARQTSLFMFANHFFATLKSIVTSYAGYLLDAVNEVLRSTTSDISCLSAGTLALYSSTLDLVTTIATHDADGFFASPSHFSPLSSLLVAQLTLASSRSKQLRAAVSSAAIPALVALAAAVQDTPAHHHTLNHLLCGLRRHDSAAVRLASIRAHAALTRGSAGADHDDHDGLGDEWIQNVVLGQTSAEGGVGGSGETMIYVNEMLEDDDETVEKEVRDWVRLVREMVGEDVFEV